MEIKGEAKLVRIFVGDADKSDHIPVYEKIVLEAKPDLQERLFLRV